MKQKTFRKQSFNFHHFWFNIELGMLIADNITNESLPFTFYWIFVQVSDSK